MMPNSNSVASNKRNMPSSANPSVQQHRKSAKGPSNSNKAPSSVYDKQPVATASGNSQQADKESLKTDSSRIIRRPQANLVQQQHLLYNSYDESKKQNHCEIEKRRRDKMNQYIVELASVIPSFANNQSKFDKLTVLRMAVQHVKSLRSSLCSFSSFHLRPSFLSSGNLLKNLILQMASQEAQDNLFMVVTCDSGKVLFVSQSAKDILNQEQNELVGQCLFDLLHKDDVFKVKDQISYFNLMPKEMLVDSKTLQPIKQNQRQSFRRLQNKSNSTPQPGVRRSFFCRMRSGRNEARGGSGSSSSNISSSNSEGKSTSTASPSSSTTSSPPLEANQRAISSSFTRQQSTSRKANHHDKDASSNQVSDRSNKQSGQSYSVSHKLGDATKHRSDSTFKTNPIKSAEPPKTTSNIDADDEDEIIGNRMRNSSRDNLKGSQTISDCNTSGKISKSHKSSTRQSGHSLSSSGNSSSGVSSGSATSPGRNSHLSGSSGSSSDSNSSTSSNSSVNDSTSTNQTNDQSSGNESSQSNKTNCEMRKRNNNSKTSNNPIVSRSSNISMNKKHLHYTVMHCTGYLKSITLRSDEIDDDDFDECKSDNSSSLEDEENDGCRTINCLVAVCRRSPMYRDLKPDRPLTFTCRYSVEGKFVFADQRTTVALGYTPQQLLGTSHYTYCHKDSVNTFKECHRQSILKSEPVSSDIYQFKRANGQHLWLQTSLKSFRNPWTKFIDYIVANHTTAEGNDPRYNEGCVPTKFNQDMTGDASQSSSPASSSSLSLPSMDSKKSLSPGSSVGSSYSMDSFASSGSIQALLNQIDRVKSGGLRHALDFHRRKGGMHIPRSDGGSSARKSNDDNGNYSDVQSCSSISSQVSSDYMNMQNVTNFVDNQTSTGNQSSVGGPTGANSTPGDPYYNQKTNTFRANQSLYGLTNYLQTGPCQPMMEGATIDTASLKFQSSNMDNERNQKTDAKLSRKSSRPTGGTLAKHQRHHTSPPYHHRNLQTKSAYSYPSSDTGNETATWSNSSGSVYSTSSSHQNIRNPVGLAMTNQSTNVVKDGGQPSNRVCGLIEGQAEMDKIHRQGPFVMQTVENASMNMVTEQIQMKDQMGGIGIEVNGNYNSNGLMPVNSYINQDVNNRYAIGSVNCTQMHQMSSADHIQSNLPMTMQPQPQQSQAQRPQQSNNTNHVAMPMMWNTTDNSYQQNLNTMHNAGVEQIFNTGDVALMNMDVGSSGNQMIAQQTTVPCQQCANHRCSNQQMMMSNNTDLSSVNLTSVLEDGDLDEDQLLEYLAVCEPEAQLYHLKSNAFPQHNMYHQQL